MATAGTGLTLGTLWLDVQASIDDAAKTLQKFGKDVSDQIDDQKKKWEGLSDVGGVFKDIGQSMTLAITAPLVGLGAAALNTGKDFESSFNKIQANSDATAAEMEMLQKQALQLGKDTAFSAQQAADGMAVFASAGFKANEIYAAMPGTLALAAAGQIKVADAAVITKDIMGQFGIAAADSGHIADVLAKSLTDTSASMSDLALSLKYVGPTANAMGISLEEVTAALVELDAAGLRGEVAGTGLRGMLAALKAPSNDAAEALADLKVKVSDSSGKFLPLADILEQTKKGMEALNNPVKAAADLQKIFGTEASNVAQVLIGKGGPALKDYAAGLQDSAGAAEAFAAKLNKGLNYALDQLGGSVETAGIALSKVLIPFAVKALSVLTDLVNNIVLPAVEAFQKWPGPLQAAAVALAAIAAAAGPTLYVVGQLAGAFVNIMTTAALVKEGFVALTTTVKTLQYAIANDLTGALIGGEATLAKYLVTLSTVAPIAAVAGLAIATVGAAWYATSKQIDELDARYKRFLEDAKAQAIRKAFADGMDIADIAKKFTTSLDDVKTALGVSADAAKGALAMVAKLGVTLVEVGQNGKATAKTEAELAAEAEEAAKQHKKLTDALDDAKKNLAAVEDYARRTGKGWDAAEAAVGKVTKAQAALDKELLKANPLLNTATGSVAEFGKKVNAGLKPLDDLTREAGEAAVEVDAASANVELMGDEMARAQPPVVDLGAALGKVTLPAYTAADAFKELGLTASTSFENLARTAWQAYDTIAEASTSSAEDQRRALIIATQAQLDYQASIGQVSSSTQLQLAKLQQAERDYQNNSVNGWRILWQSVRDGMSDMFHSINEAVVSGDWAAARDRILDDLKQMGVAVLERFVKPAEDAIAAFVANTLTALLSGQGLGGVSKAIADLGKQLSGVFKTNTPGATTPPFAGGSIPGLGGGSGASGASSAGGAASAGGGVLGIVNAVTGAVTAVASVLQLFGVGQGGQLDRLNRISDATGIMAWDLNEGGLRVAVLDIRNMLYNFTQPTLENIGRACDYMGEQLAAINNSTAKQFNLNLTGTDPQAVAAYLATQLRLQGGAA